MNFSGTLSNPQVSQPEKNCELLYSDNNGTPDQLLSSSSNQILFSQLNTTYAEFEFEITSDITISSSYWFILDIPTYPLTSDNAFISLAYVSDSSLYSTSFSLYFVPANII